MMPYGADLSWDEHKPGEGNTVQKYDYYYYCEWQLLTFGILGRAQ